MTNHVADAAAHSLAEAEKLLGISGPKYTIEVDGRLYRLIPKHLEPPAAAASMFSEMLYIVRHWLGEHPDAAAEMAEYGMPIDDEARALPFPTLISIALGVQLEVYAHKHGGALVDDSATEA
jgi:hypothetical protein